MAVTKSQLTDSLKNQLNCDRAQAQRILEAFLEIMKTAFESGDDVLISGFGKFEIQAKRERRGRNPQTGTELILSPRKVLKFRPAGRLRDKINTE